MCGRGLLLFYMWNLTIGLKLGGNVGFSWILPAFLFVLESSRPDSEQAP